MTLQAVAESDAETLRVELAAEREMNALLVEESMASLELAAEDRGWQLLSAQLEQEFTRAGLSGVAKNCRLMAIASPLIKRALQLRIGYVWGQGVTITARAGADAEQDVDAVVQAFWDDELNRKALTGSQAQEELERALGTDGQIFLAFFTNPLVGSVQVRSTPFDEIQDVINNPEDRDEPWFYVRQYQATVLEAGYSGQTRRRRETRRELHPAVGYRPATRVKSIDGMPVMWDAPILHVPVNRLDGWKWGIPDSYASLPWARAYDGFLTDWARLVKALSKFAWRLTGDKSSRARKAAETLRANMPQRTTTDPSGVGGVGAVAATGAGTHLEAIPKSGATIDSESGKPLAGLVAAGLGVPVTMLLADPGTTGARAVAETLDDPLVLEMGMRQQLWASVIRTVTGYVIDQAVKAPRGPLRGTVTRDRATGREVVTLAGDVERTVEVSFPPINDLDPVKLVEALVSTDGILPDKWLIKSLLKALGEEDVDEILDEVTDEDGNLLSPRSSAGQAAIDRFRRGEDPAESLR